MSAAAAVDEHAPRRVPLDAVSALGRAATPGPSVSLGFLVVLLVFTKLIQPSYGVTGVQGLAISVLPLALAAVAQAIVVISGGIDLSIGAMMALTSVVVGRPDEGPARGVRRRGRASACCSSASSLGAINGSLVVLTRVPDIVVTLAMSFVWAGCALLVLKTPGGGSAAVAQGARQSGRSAASGSRGRPSS